LFAAVILFMPPIAAPQSKRGPLRIADALSALSFQTYHRVTFSPDGQWVAYVTSDARRRETAQDKRYSLFTRTGAPGAFVGSDVWITNTRTGESENLTGGKGSSWGQVWSPNGQYLAFCSDRGGMANLWVWEKTSGKLRKVSEAIFYTPLLGDASVWTPDGRKLIFSALPEGVTAEDAIDARLGIKKQPKEASREGKANVIVYSSPAASGAEKDPGKLRDGSSAIRLRSVPVDLLSVEVVTGNTEHIARQVAPTQTQISPDGRTIAFLNWTDFESGANSNPFFGLTVDLAVSSLQDNVAPRVIVPGIRNARISWSPDGARLSYTTAEGECFLIPAAGGVEPRKLTTSPHPSFHHQFRAPLWDDQGQSLYFLANHALWRVSVADGKTEEVARIQNRKLLGIVAPAAGGRFWSPDRGRSALLVTRDDETKQVGFYQVDLATGKSKRLIEESKDYGFSIEGGLSLFQLLPTRQALLPIPAGS
jgi:Tol biopolymer transport system component